MAWVWLCLFQAANLTQAMLQQAVAMQETCHLALALQSAAWKTRNVQHAEPKNHTLTLLLALLLCLLCLLRTSACLV